jgi:uncharacterized protein (TIGR03435 family)
MNRAISGTIVAALWAGAAGAQSARPAYEAAFIKPNTSGTNSTSSHGSPGQLVMSNQSLKRLIERAYNVKSFQVTGPEWLDNIRFDIVAKNPPGTKDGDRFLLMRTLLEDRFKLAVHLETKDAPGYALVAAKSGFKLTPEQPGPGGTNSEGGSVVTFKGTKIAMPELADYIARRLDAMVVDKTGIEGVYSFELHWASDNQNTDGRDAELRDAIGTLGLHLQAQKLPVQMVVVDHVERVPTAN